MEEAFKIAFLFAVLVALFAGAAAICVLVERLRRRPDPLPDEPLRQRFELEIDAEYFQFCLWDLRKYEIDAGGAGPLWNAEGAGRRIEASPGIVAVGTSTEDMASVTVEVAAAEPPEDPARWERVEDCNLDVPSGTVVAAGCLGGVPPGIRVRVPPGPYRVRVFCSSTAAEAPGEPGCREAYRIVLWPGRVEP